MSFLIKKKKINVFLLSISIFFVFVVSFFYALEPLYASHTESDGSVKVFTVTKFSDCPYTLDHADDCRDLKDVNSRYCGDFPLRDNVQADGLGGKIETMCKYRNEIQGKYTFDPSKIGRDGESLNCNTCLWSTPPPPPDCDITYYDLTKPTREAICNAMSGNKQNVSYPKKANQTCTENGVYQSTYTIATSCCIWSYAYVPLICKTDSAVDYSQTEESTNIAKLADNSLNVCDNSAITSQPATRTCPRVCKDPDDYSDAESLCTQASSEVRENYGSPPSDMWGSKTVTHSRRYGLTCIDNYSKTTSVRCANHEVWWCTSWGTCNHDTRKQTRSCTEGVNQGSTVAEPVTEKSCVPTCDDSDYTEDSRVCKPISGLYATPKNAKFEITMKKNAGTARGEAKECTGDATKINSNGPECCTVNGWIDCKWDPVNCPVEGGPDQEKKCTPVVCNTAISDPAPVPTPTKNACPSQTGTSDGGSFPPKAEAGATLRYIGNVGNESFAWLADRFLYNNGSKIGIGLFSALPTAQLEINGTLKLNKINAFNPPSPIAGMIYFDDGVKKFKASQDGTNWIDLIGGGSGGSSQWADILGGITYTGDVGIGTTAPATGMKLDVNGNINTSGQLCIKGDCKDWSSIASASTQNFAPQSDTLGNSDGWCGSKEGSWSMCVYSNPAGSPQPTITWQQINDISPNGITEPIGKITRKENGGGQGEYRVHLHKQSHGMDSVLDKTFTFSFWAKTASNTSITLALGADADQGTKGCAISSSWTRCSITKKTSADESKYSSPDELRAYFYTSEGDIFVYGAQIELGSRETVYQRASFFRQVGIGTTTPEKLLHINGYGDNGLLISAAGKNTKISMHVAGGDYGYLSLGGTGNSETALRGNGQGSSFGGNVSVNGDITAKQFCLGGVCKPSWSDVNGGAQKMQFTRIMNDKNTGAYANIGSIARIENLPIYAKLKIWTHHGAALMFNEYEVSEAYYVTGIPGGTIDWVEVPPKSVRSWANDGRKVITVDARLLKDGANLELRLRRTEPSAENQPITIEFETNGTFSADASGKGSSASVASGYLGQNGWFFPTTKHPFKATTDGMFITGDGRVGIGTTAPAYKLDVSGNINASGNISIDGAAMGYSGTGRTGYGIAFPATSDDGQYMYGEHDGGDTSNLIFHQRDNMSDGVIFRNTDWGDKNVSPQTLDYMKISREKLFYIGGNVGIGTVNPRHLLSVGTSIESMPGYDKLLTTNIELFTPNIPGEGDGIITLHHGEKIAHQLRYDNGELYLENSHRPGYGTTFTPNLLIGGRVGIGVTDRRVWGFTAQWVDGSNSGFDPGWANIYKIFPFFSDGTVGESATVSTVANPSGISHVVELKWMAVAGATRYEVWRTRCWGIWGKGYIGKLATVTTTTYKDSIAINGSLDGTQPTYTAPPALLPYALNVNGQVNAKDGLCINGDCKSAWSQVGVQGDFLPLSGGILSSATDGVLSLKTTDNTWLYTNWYDKDNKRRIWMGLDADLSYFNIQPDPVSPSAKGVILGGNVGIGMTPEYKLDVNGNMRVKGSDGLVVENNGEADMLFRDTTNDQQWEVGTNANGYYIDDDKGENSPERYALVIKKGTRNVGIGTTSPGGKLDVRGSIVMKGTNNLWSGSSNKVRNGGFRGGYDGDSTKAGWGITDVTGTHTGGYPAVWETNLDWTLRDGDSNTENSYGSTLAVNTTSANGEFYVYSDYFKLTAGRLHTYQALLGNHRMNWVKLRVVTYATKGGTRENEWYGTLQGDQSTTECSANYSGGRAASGYCNMWGVFLPTDSERYARIELVAKGQILGQGDGWLFADQVSVVEGSQPVAFSPNTWESLSNGNIYNAGGNVGIGTTDPGVYKLNVTGDVNIGEMEKRRYLNIVSKEWPEIRFTTPTNGENTNVRLGVAHEDRTDYPVKAGDWYAWMGKTNRMGIVLRTNDDILLAPTAGNVGIGTTKPTIKLAIGDTDTGLHSAGDGLLDIYSNNINTISIRSGKVGIGITQRSGNGPLTGLSATWSTSNSAPGWYYGGWVVNFKVIPVFDGIVGIGTSISTTNPYPTKTSPPYANVNLTWTATPGATSYQIWRTYNWDGQNNIGMLGTTSSLTYNDTNITLSGSLPPPDPAQNSLPQPLPYVLNVKGDIGASGSLFVGQSSLALNDSQKLAFAHSTVGFDVAELFETEEVVAVGDVIVTSEKERTLKKSSKPYEAQIVGIVSGSPALLFEGSRSKLGATQDQFTTGTKPPIALSGRVPVKISLENGPIKPGDYLTSSSISGVAMRATKVGMTLGTALESYTGWGDGTVLVFINIGEKNSVGAIEELQKTNEELKKRLEDLEKMIKK